MNLKTLKAYMADCQRYGWTPCLAGAAAYNRQVKAGSKNFSKVVENAVSRFV